MQSSLISPACLNGSQFALIPSFHPARHGSRFATEIKRTSPVFGPFSDGDCWLSLYLAGAKLRGEEHRTLSVPPYIGEGRFRGACCRRSKNASVGESQADRGACSVPQPSHMRKSIAVNLPEAEPLPKSGSMVIARIDRQRLHGPRFWDRPFRKLPSYSMATKFRRDVEAPHAANSRRSPSKKSPTSPNSTGTKSSRRLKSTASARPTPSRSRSCRSRPKVMLLTPVTLILNLRCRSSSTSARRNSRRIRRP